MTVLELAQRDFRKANYAHTHASVKPNVSPEELANTLELVCLRKQILEIIKEKENAGQAD